MDLEHLSEKERSDVLAEIADMYYNQGKTQSEIAVQFQSNRFRIAKLLQDARAEQIVEIRINRSNERNHAVEEALMRAFPLQRVIVVNTQFAPYVDGLMQVGKVGADYLNQLLTPGGTIGVAWGKTIYGVVSQLTSTVASAVTAVQLSGNCKRRNPATDARELVRTIAAKYNGDYYYLNAPLYVNDPAARAAMLEEPMIQETLQRTRRMDVILSGVGATSSLPFTNPMLQPYLTAQDIERSYSCIGSMYGYVLDRAGCVADLDLNRKLISAALEDVLRTPHRLVVACGRHKTEMIARSLDHRLFNELLTDNDTALYLLDQYGPKK